MASLANPSARLRMLGALVLSVLVARAAAQHAAGTWSCSDDASCEAIRVKDPSGTFAQGTQCVRDPLSPDYGYCGYVGAQCNSVYQCDFGQCINGVCRGYFGDTCASGPNSTAANDCLGLISCGSDGTCGGGNATCSGQTSDGQSVHSDYLCTTETCLAPSTGSTWTCSATSAASVSNGQGCTSNAMCLSGLCSTTGTTAWTCVAAASQAALNRRRTFRSTTLIRRAQAAGIAIPGHPIRRTTPSRPRTLDALCARGRTACALGTSLDPADGYDCVDTTASETCGGCAHGANLADPYAPAGVDCSALPGVDQVECAGGRCRIISCQAGLIRDPDDTRCL